jgi:hypothetical protein
MAHDLQTTINQSTADKFVNSVKYPFTVFERKSPYEGVDLAATTSLSLDDEILQKFDDALHIELLDEVNRLPANGYSQTSRFERSNLSIETRQSLDEIATNTRDCLAALAAHAAESDSSKPNWDGPTQQELETILDAVEAETLDLASLRIALGDWDITALIAWIRVDVRQVPTFLLGGQTISLGIKVASDGTGEVWLKHPWLKCVKKWRGICYSWKKIVKHTLLLRVTLRGIKVRAKAKAELSTQNASVLVRGKFDELRIDHRYLDQIPIEKIANVAMSNKPISIFDASRLIATIPVLNSQFAVDSIAIPTVPNEISVQVTLKQL